MQIRFGFFEGNMLFLIDNLFDCIIFLQNLTKNKIDMQTSLRIPVDILSRRIARLGHLNHVTGYLFRVLVTVWRVTLATQA